MTRPHSTTSPSIISKNHHHSHPLLYPPELLPRPTPELTHTPSATNSTSTLTYLTISLSSAAGVSKKLIIIHIHILPHSSSSLHKQRRIPDPPPQRQLLHARPIVGSSPRGTGISRSSTFVKPRTRIDKVSREPWRRPRVFQEMSRAVLMSAPKVLRLRVRFLHPLGRDSFRYKG